MLIDVAAVTHHGESKTTVHDTWSWLCTYRGYVRRAFDYNFQGSIMLLMH